MLKIYPDLDKLEQLDTPLDKIRAFNKEALSLLKDAKSIRTHTQDLYELWDEAIFHGMDDPDYVNGLTQELISIPEESVKTAMIQLDSFPRIVESAFSLLGMNASKQKQGCVTLLKAVHEKYPDLYDAAYDRAVENSTLSAKRLSELLATNNLHYKVSQPLLENPASPVIGEKVTIEVPAHFKVFTKLAVLGLANKVGLENIQHEKLKEGAITKSIEQISFSLVAPDNSNLVDFFQSMDRIIQDNALPTVKVGIDELPEHPSGIQRDYVDHVLGGNKDFYGFYALSATYGAAEEYPKGFSVTLVSARSKEEVVQAISTRQQEQEVEIGI